MKSLESSPDCKSLSHWLDTIFSEQDRVPTLKKECDVFLSDDVDYIVENNSIGWFQNELKAEEDRETNQDLVTEENQRGAAL